MFAISLSPLSFSGEDTSDSFAKRVHSEACKGRGDVWEQPGEPARPAIHRSQMSPWRVFKVAITGISLLSFPISNCIMFFLETAAQALVRGPRHYTCLGLSAFVLDRGPLPRTQVAESGLIPTSQGHA